MNKEKVNEIIVSIQNHLEKYEERFKNGAIDSTTYYLYCDDARTLLDYITNLQEENNNLEEENKNDYFIHMEEWARAIGNNAKLRERIDKAIEYIERNCLEFNVKYACQGLNNDKVDVLLDILRGEDNE